MFRIKICGVTNVPDALTLIEAGADAIGLNFYSPSPRSVTVEHAKNILQAIEGRLVTVGVFVNASLCEVKELAQELKLSAVQLHGDEPPSFVQDLPSDLPIVRAFRITEEGLGPVASYLEECRNLGRLPDMALVDAASPKAYGGTGEKLDWEQLAEQKSQLRKLPLVLAGGLKPGNVSAAIRTCLPCAVDTASGVELSPGEKSAELVYQFVKNAQEAFND